MIVLPKRYSYVEAYLTLRCNFSCKYCINKHSGVVRGRPEISTDLWICGLNNINTNHLPLTLGGGEPTIVKGFYDIVNGLKKSTKVDLLSNGTFDVNEFTYKIPQWRFGKRKLDYYKTIRLSFHKESSDKDVLIDKTRILEEKGYSAGIFSINHPNNLSENLHMVERCRRAGVYFFIRDFLGFYDDKLFGYYKHQSAMNGNKKKCLCRTEELLIGPDGTIFRCHRDLYNNDAGIGSILNIESPISDNFLPCNNYGVCNPCDMKLKLSSDLKSSKCSVEIKDVEND